MILFSLLFLTATAKFSTLPKQPILGAPFEIIARDNTHPIIYIAKDELCENKISGNSSFIGEFTIDGQKYAPYFWLTDPPLDKIVYVCNPRKEKVYTINFFSIIYSPQYAFENQDRVVTFTGNMPSAAFASLESFSNCQSSGNKPFFRGPINSNYQTTIRGNVLKSELCLEFFSNATKSNVKVRLGSFFIVQSFDITRHELTRYEKTTLEISNFNSGSLSFMSQDPHCAVQQFILGNVTLSHDQVATVKVNTIDLPKGSYNFCLGFYYNAIFIPAKTPVKIKEFSLQPRTIFKDFHTIMRFELDSPDKANVSFSTIPCNNVTDNSWKRPPALIMNNTAAVFDELMEVYSCIQKSNQWIQSGFHKVVHPYTVNISLDSFVAGPPTRIVIPHPKSIPVEMGLFKDKNCQGIPFIPYKKSIANAGSQNIWETVIPATTPNNSLTICVKTEDATTVYPLKTLPIRRFEINRAAALTNIPTELTIDDALKVGDSPSYIFSHNDNNNMMNCKGNSTFGDRSPFETPAIFSFPRKGIYTLCSRTHSQAPYTPVYDLKVHDKPSSSPNSTFVSLPTNVIIEKLPASSVVFIAKNCSPSAVKEYKDLGASFPVTFMSSGLRSICASFDGAQGAVSEVFNVGTIIADQIDIYPRQTFASYKTRFNVSMKEGSLWLLDGANAYYLPDGDGTACQQVPDNAQVTPLVTGNGIPYIYIRSPTKPGSYGLCVGGHEHANMRYFHAGMILVEEPYTIILTPRVPAVGTPFTFQVKGNSALPGWYSITHVSELCRNPLVSGPLVNGLSGEITLHKAGEYTLCLNLPNNNNVPAMTIKLISNITQLWVSLGVPTIVPLPAGLTSGSVRAHLSAIDYEPETILRPCREALSSTVALVEPHTGNNSQLFVTIHRPGRFLLCAVSGANGRGMAAAAEWVTLIPILEFIAIVNPMSYQTRGLACDVVPLSYNSPAEANDVSQSTTTFLYNGPCCEPRSIADANMSLPGPLDPSAIVTIIEKPLPSGDQALRVLNVTDSQLALFAPQRSFPICLTNQTLCLQVGMLTFDVPEPGGSLCVEQTLPDNQNKPRFVPPVAPLTLYTKKTLPLTLFIIAFTLLLLCCLIVFVIGLCVRGRRIVPKDDMEGFPLTALGISKPLEEGTGQSEWQQGYDRVLQARRAYDTMVAGSIPIDMRLDICPNPIEEQQATLDQEEINYRILLARQEAEQRRALIEMHGQGAQAALRAEAARVTQEQEEHLVAVQRYQEYVQALLVRIADTEPEESAERLQIEEAEDAARLAIAERERDLWRQQMDRERAQLQAMLESDPYWRSRRRQLREANDRAFASIGDVLAGVSGGPADSGSVPSAAASTSNNTTARSHPSQRMYQGTNYPNNEPSGANISGGLAGPAQPANSNLSPSPVARVKYSTQRNVDPHSIW